MLRTKIYLLKQIHNEYIEAQKRDPPETHGLDLNALLKIYSNVRERLEIQGSEPADFHPRFTILQRF